VKSIIDGTPIEEVARAAFSKIQERLEELGRADVGAELSGRNWELRRCIVPHLTAIVTSHSTLRHFQGVSLH